MEVELFESLHNAKDIPVRRGYNYLQDLKLNIHEIQKSLSSTRDPVEQKKYNEKLEELTGRLAEAYRFLASKLDLQGGITPTKKHSSSSSETPPKTPSRKHSLTSPKTPATPQKKLLDSPYSTETPMRTPMRTPMETLTRTPPITPHGFNSEGNYLNDARNPELSPNEKTPLTQDNYESDRQYLKSMHFLGYNVVPGVRKTKTPFNSPISPPDTPETEPNTPNSHDFRKRKPYVQEEDDDAYDGGEGGGEVKRSKHDKDDLEGGLKPDDINTNVLVHNTILPTEFAKVRQLYNIYTEDFTRSLLDLEDSGTRDGKSEMLFMMSKDRKYILKTLKRDEFHYFIQIMDDYVKYMMKHYTDTLLPRFYGLYYIDNEHESRYLIAMNNVFEHLPRNMEHVAFDLKGSTYKREASNQETTLKDLDLNRQKIKLNFEGSPNFLKALNRDSMWLRDHNLIDYSLLIGIVKNQGNTDVKGLSGIWEGENATYFLGIIDILQRYNLRKSVESLVKTKVLGQKNISAVKPDYYQKRFYLWIRQHIEGGIEETEEIELKSTDRGGRSSDRRKRKTPEIVIKIIEEEFPEMKENVMEASQQLLERYQYKPNIFGAWREDDMEHFEDKLRTAIQESASRGPLPDQPMNLY